MDDRHQVHLERYLEVLSDKADDLMRQLSAAAQALDWAVIENVATQRISRRELQILEVHGLIGRGASEVDDRRKAVADLGRRLGALEALIEAVDEIGRERRNRPKEQA